MGGGPAPYTPPAPVPTPIEDSVAARHEAAALTAKMGSSRAANDLNQETSDKADAVTRKDLGLADTLAPQPRPHGPAAGARAPRVSPATAMNGMSGSAVLTG